MNELIAGTIAAPKDLPADAVGSVGTPNTLPADNAASVGTPNTVPSDSAGIIAAPIALPSQGAAALPRSLTPMVDFDFAAKRYAQDGVAVAFEDIFTYTRASSATFTNRRLKKNGGYEYFLDTDYVGSVENLFTYSEDFDNAVWDKGGGAAISVNATLSPNNDLSAAKYYVLSSNNAGAQIQHTLTTVNSTSYTISVYAKAAEVKFLQILLPSGVLAGNPVVNFDLIGGGINQINTGFQGKIENTGNGWFKCSASFTSVDVSTNFLIGMADGLNSSWAVGFQKAVGDGLYLWGAQVTESAKPLPYVKTLDVAVTKTFAETLRTEYDAVTGKNLGALIEGSNTNLLTRSENIDLWSVYDEVAKPSTYTRTANYGLAPDSTMSATRISGSLFDTASGSRLRFRKIAPVVNGSDCSLSFWVKSLGPNYSAQFHFQGGERSSIVMTNEWQRVSYSSVVATTTLYVGITLQGSIAGTTGFDFLMWGGQLEQKPFVSSYIRTEGSAVSRSPDGLAVNSFNFNNEEFSVAANFSKPYILDQGGSSSYVWSVNDGANSDRVINILSTKAIRAVKTDNGSNTADFRTAFDLLGGNVSYSGVVTFKNSEISGYLNGALYGSDSSSPTNYKNFDNFIIGSNLGSVSSLNGHMGKVSIYAQALTQQEITLL